MNRKELEAYILETYAAEMDRPWAKYPNYAVFRHTGNQKWFALVMDVPREKLGLSKSGLLEVVNVKCDPLLIGSFRQKPGIYPAYHMSKASWLSVALDGGVDGNEMKLLLDMSFDLTAPKAKKRKRGRAP